MISFTDEDIKNLKDLLLPSLTAGLTWLFARHKNNSDVLKTQAETNKISTDTTLSISEFNLNQFNSLINAQKDRIQDLKTEVETLKKEIQSLREDYNEKLNILWQIIIDTPKYKHYSQNDIDSFITFYKTIDSKSDD